MAALGEKVRNELAERQIKRYDEILPDEVPIGIVKRIKDEFFIVHFNTGRWMIIFFSDLGDPKQNMIPWTGQFSSSNDVVLVQQLRLFDSIDQFDSENNRNEFIVSV